MLDSIYRLKLKTTNIALDSTSAICKLLTSAAIAQMISLMYMEGRGLDSWSPRTSVIETIYILAWCRWWPNQMGLDSSRLSAAHEVRYVADSP